jgi:hypothetical protein
MQYKSILFSLLTGLICGALSYWFNAYNVMNIYGISIYYIMGISSLLSVLALGFVYKKYVYSIPLFFSIGFVISVLGRIFFDLSNDPTSHNLFPLEIILVLFIIVPSSYLSSFLINLVNKSLSPYKNNR